jgi:hypothetical protein
MGCLYLKGLRKSVALLLAEELSSGVLSTLQIRRVSFAHKFLFKGLTISFWNGFAR